MSIIRFTCDPSKMEEIKSGVWDIIHQHYMHTVFPNSNVTYEHEGEAVYSERLHALMNNGLCQINDSEEGFSVEFDSTEDAGLQIVWEVYQTGMGYHDQGLSYLDPVFNELIKRFPDVRFEAVTECDDGWSCEQSKYVYDGKQLTKTEMDEYEEEPTASPEDHFLYTVPRLYIDIETLDQVCKEHGHALSEEVAKTGSIDAHLIVMEYQNLNYTVVWTPATEDAVAEAVANGYPESMGAVAFMFVYERFSDGIITDDLKAIRAVVIQDDMTAGFAEMCNDDSIYGFLNAFYLGVIGVHQIMVNNNLYSTYASLNAEESGMIVSVKDQQISIDVVSGNNLPELDSDDRSLSGFNFFF